MIIVCQGGTADASMLLRYTFDDQADPTANSGSLGAAHNGDLRGNATFTPFGGGAALSLDGDTSNNSVVVVLGDESAFDISDDNFSLFARFQTDFFDNSDSNVRALAWKQAVGSSPNFSFGVRQENGLGQFTLNDGSEFVTVFTSQPLNDGAPHTMLAVRQGDWIGLLVDGMLDAVEPIPAGFGSTLNNEDLIIGGRTLRDDDDWVGLIDEIQVHDTALASIPEPATVALLGLGGLAVLRHRR